MRFFATDSTRWWATMAAAMVLCGCNTFFASPPEFGSGDAGPDDVIDTADASDVIDTQDGSEDASDISDTADARDTDASDASNQGPEPFSVPNVHGTRTKLLPRISLSVTYGDVAGGPAFGLGYLLAEERTADGVATFHRIDIPDLQSTLLELGAGPDVQLDVAVSVDANGELVYGAVQRCQRDVVARLLRPSQATDEQPIFTDRGCPTTRDPDPQQIAVTGGFERFNSATGTPPHWVFEGGNSPTVLSSIKSPFRPENPENHDDQVLSVFNAPEVDPTFIRASGGPMVMLRGQGPDHDMLMWDAIQRANFDLLPNDVGASISESADLVWLEDSNYIVFSQEGANLLSADALTCTMAANSVSCQGPDALEDYSEPNIRFVRAMAIHGGVVVATASEGSGRTQVRVRVFDVSVNQSNIDVRPVGEAGVFEVTSGSILALDVAATYVASDLYAAVAYVNAEDNSTPGTVELRGFRYDGLLSETR